MVDFDKIMMEAEDLLMKVQANHDKLNQPTPLSSQHEILEVEPGTPITLDPGDGDYLEYIPDAVQEQPLDPLVASPTLPTMVQNIPLPPPAYEEPIIPARPSEPPPEMPTYRLTTPPMTPPSRTATVMPPITLDEAFDEEQSTRPPLLPQRIPTMKGVPRPVPLPLLPARDGSGDAIDPARPPRGLTLRGLPLCGRYDYAVQDSAALILSTLLDLPRLPRGRPALPHAEPRPPPTFGIPDDGSVGGHGHSTPLDAPQPMEALHALTPLAAKSAADPTSRVLSPSRPTQPNLTATRMTYDLDNVYDTGRPAPIDPAPARISPTQLLAPSATVQLTPQKVIRDAARILGPDPPLTAADLLNSPVPPHRPQTSMSFQPFAPPKLIRTLEGSLVGAVTREAARPVPQLHETDDPYSMLSMYSTAPFQPRPSPRPSLRESHMIRTPVRPPVATRDHLDDLLSTFLDDMVGVRRPTR